MSDVKHIVQFSGGKDSTCMLLMMLEKGMQVDEIIFCDTGMEFPQMYEHIDKVEQYIGRKVTRLKAEHSFLHMMRDYTKTKGAKAGQRGYGWATMLVRWCTIYHKQDVQKKYTKGINHISYIGIAYDEPKRHTSIQKHERHPLYDWRITEAEALSYCKRHSFNWGGLYDKFHRVSCWCCPLKSLDEMRILYHDFPALWQKLKDMDNCAWNQFRADYSVQQLEDKFKREDYLKKISIPLFDVNTDDM